VTDKSDIGGGGGGEGEGDGRRFDGSPGRDQGLREAQLRVRVRERGGVD
jgi:hypothetical protein